MTLTRSVLSSLNSGWIDSRIMELGVNMAELYGMAKCLCASDLVEKKDYCPFL